MEIIKDKERENVELVNKGMRLSFSLTELNFLKVAIRKDNNEKLWLNETFEVEKKDSEIYQMIDRLFFSYGDEVLFDTYGDSLTLKHEDDKYKFFFLSNLTRLDNEMYSEFVDYTQENSSMEALFLDFLNLKNTNNKEQPKKLIKRNK